MRNRGSNRNRWRVAGAEAFTASRYPLARYASPRRATNSGISHAASPDASDPVPTWSPDAPNVKRMAQQTVIADAEPAARPARSRRTRAAAPLQDTASEWLGRARTRLGEAKPSRFLRHELP